MCTNRPKQTKSSKIISLVIPPKTAINICNLEISFDNSIIALQDGVKYLDITLDSGIKFNLHMKILESKIARSIKVISKLKQVLPASTLQTLYYSIIHPHLFYDIFIWGSTFKTYLRKLPVYITK